MASVVFDKLPLGLVIGFDGGLNIINSHELVCASCNHLINVNDKKIVKFPTFRTPALAVA